VLAADERCQLAWIVSCVTWGLSIIVWFCIRSLLLWVGGGVLFVLDLTPTSLWVGSTWGFFFGCLLLAFFVSQGLTEWGVCLWLRYRPVGWAKHAASCTTLGPGQRPWAWLPYAGIGLGLGSLLVHWAGGCPPGCVACVPLIAAWWGGRWLGLLFGGALWLGSLTSAVWVLYR
jgi:hypothetical protein